MIEIIPSVLAGTLPTFRARLAIAERLSRRIHLDVMDQKFVPTRSLPAERLRRQVWQTKVEMHIMATRPVDWLAVALDPHVDEVVLHVEIGESLRYAIAVFRSNRKKIHLAINPTTSVTRLEPWLRYVQGVQIMTIHPGRNHAPFQSAMIRRIQTFHAHHPGIRIACDGGVTPKTIRPLLAAGATRLIVGSFVQSAENPRRAWQQLWSAARGTQTV